jgi:hypothetical protein
MNNTTINPTTPTAPALNEGMADIPADLLRLAELLTAASRKARRNIARHQEIAQSIGVWETIRHSVSGAIISDDGPAPSAAEVARLLLVLEAAEQGINDYAPGWVDEVDVVR